MWPIHPESYRDSCRLPSRSQNRTGVRSCQTECALRCHFFKRQLATDNLQPHNGGQDGRPTIRTAASGRYVACRAAIFAAVVPESNVIWPIFPPRHKSCPDRILTHIQPLGFRRFFSSEQPIEDALLPFPIRGDLATDESLQTRRELCNRCVAVEWRNECVQMIRHDYGGQRLPFRVGGAVIFYCGEDLRIVQYGPSVRDTNCDEVHDSLVRGQPDRDSRRSSHSLDLSRTRRRPKWPPYKSFL